MVYGVFYLPLDLERSLLTEAHSFDDSKVLTPAVRSSLMQALCTPGSDLHTHSGWATCLLSARDIGAGMLQPSPYNLNAQAMDATVALVRGVLEKGVNVRELYVDTIGRPETYQKRLQQAFPTMKITVAKKADSLYPCVSAASVAAKVTRDAALDVCAEHVASMDEREPDDEDQVREPAQWGSGYPSDARCVGWMKANMDPVFGWGSECRFSWGTAKEMLEVKGNPLKVEWAAVEEEDGDMKMTSFYNAKGEEPVDELSGWFGRRVGNEVF
jgi:ribonuclease H2 subunit A